jgi:hypothetical protein
MANLPTIGDIVKAKGAFWTQSVFAPYLLHPGLRTTVKVWKMDIKSGELVCVDRFTNMISARRYISQQLALGV